MHSLKYIFNNTTHTFYISNIYYVVLKLHKNLQSFCYITCYLLTRLLWQLEIGLRTPSLEQARCTFIPSNVSEQRSLKTKGIRMVKKVWSTLQVPPRAFIQLHIHKWWQRVVVHRGLLTRGRIKLSFSPSHHP